MEKTVAGAYEMTQRPAEYHYLPYRERVLDQAVMGLSALQSELPANQDFFGGSAPDLADVNAVVALDFLAIVAPERAQADALGGLRALSERANDLDAFAATRWTG